MSNIQKTYNKIMSGKNDSNITFAELIKILTLLGFQLRIKGSHRILYKEGLLEIINLQAKENGKAKEYQVRQVRNIIRKYNLGLSNA